MTNGGMPLETPRLQETDFFTIADFQEAYRNTSWGWESGKPDCYGVKEHAPGLACYIHADAGGYSNTIQAWRVPISGSELLKDPDSSKAVNTTVPNCVGYMHGRARELWGNALVNKVRKQIQDTNETTTLFGSKEDVRSEPYWKLFQMAQTYLQNNYGLQMFRHDAEQIVEDMLYHGNKTLEYQVPFKVSNPKLKHVTSKTDKVASALSTNNLNSGRDYIYSENRYIDIYACQDSDFEKQNGKYVLNPACKPVKGCLIVYAQKLISQSWARYGDDIKDGYSSMGHVAFVEEVLEDGVKCNIGQSGWRSDLFSPKNNFDPIRGSYSQIDMDRVYSARIGKLDAEGYCWFEDTTEYFEAYIYPPEECEFGSVSRSQFALPSSDVHSESSLFRLSNRVWVV